MGLPLLAESARMASGKFSVTSEPGKGTKVSATFQASHIDTKPLGDIPGTVVTLIMGHPDVDVLYKHSVDGSEYCLDTKEIKAQLEEVPINSPDVIELIRRNIDEGLAILRRKK